MAVLQLSYKLQNLAQADLELFEFANLKQLELGAFALSLMFLGFKYEQNSPKTFLTEPNILDSVETAKISVRINIDEQLDKRFYKYLTSAKQGKSRRQAVTGLIHSGINCFFELQYLLKLANVNNDTQLINSATTALHSYALSNIQLLHSTLYINENVFNMLYLKEKYSNIVKYSSTYAVEKEVCAQSPSPIQLKSEQKPRTNTIDSSKVRVEKEKTEIAQNVVAQVEKQEEIQDFGAEINIDSSSQKKSNAPEAKSESTPSQASWLSCFDLNKL